MAGSVIERLGTDIVDGAIVHDDRPVPWPDADVRAGFRLDRRKAWAFINGQLCQSARWTQPCSGCSDASALRGGGCDECGYHGVVRRGMWVPIGYGAI